jgi:penicillin V acylase-like amidase (Ntn superfamily)
MTPMKQNQIRCTGRFFAKSGLALAACIFSVSVRACTIFVLTGTNGVLFCNNEDWSNPKARIWFVPVDGKHYGCVFVGFDDGVAQGGMNTEGLASDWVAGSKEPWNPDPALPTSVGNRQLLETCATVEQAIAYFREHRELGFYTSRILVADRTGASAIIGAKDGKLQVEKSNRCHGFGYGQRTLDLMLESGSSQPTVTNGVSILRLVCRQESSPRSTPTSST